MRINIRKKGYKAMNKRITAIAIMLALLLPAIVRAEDQLVNVATNQYAEASSSLSDEFSADKANDGINDNPDYTAWISSDGDNRPY